MTPRKQFLEKNATYTRPLTIKPKYIIVHSTASAIGTADELFRRWNSTDAVLSCHGMVDADGAIQTLPLSVLGWHVGSKGNGSTVGFEICEPKTISYQDSIHTVVDTRRYNPDDPDVKADFMRRYANAVWLAAYFCGETGLPADKVISHAEGYQLGVASNHGDPHQWFSVFGVTMDQFRAAVQALLFQPQETETEPQPEDETQTITTPPSREARFRVLIGAFDNVEDAVRLRRAADAAGFTAIAGKASAHDPWKVYAGVSLTILEAQALLEQARGMGFDGVLAWSEDYLPNKG